MLFLAVVLYVVFILITWAIMRMAGRADQWLEDYMAEQELVTSGGEDVR